MIKSISSSNYSKSLISPNNDGIRKKNTDEAETIYVKSSDKKYDSIEINNLIKDNEKRINEFKESIRSMICKQGEQSNLKLFGLNLNVSVEEANKATASLEDGGEYSIDAVATRIMDMAMALSNGDDSKISMLRDAVTKGFEAAGVEFDSVNGLPEICKKTYDEVMKRFDQWENREQ